MFVAGESFCARRTNDNPNLPFYLNNKIHYEEIFYMALTLVRVWVP